MKMPPESPDNQFSSSDAVSSEDRPGIQEELSSQGEAFNTVEHSTHTADDSSETESTVQNIEDMTLVELLGQLRHSPGQTWSALRFLLSATDEHHVSSLEVARRQPALTTSSPRVTKYLRSGVASVLPGNSQTASLSPEQIKLQQRDAIHLGLRLSALVIGLYGNNILSVQRSVAQGLNTGAPYLLLAFLTWIIADTFGYWPSIRGWWEQRRETDKLYSNASISEVRNEPAEAISWWVRLNLASAGLVASVLAAVLNINNKFTIPGVIAWVLSIGFWVAAVTPQGWNMVVVWGAVRRVRIHRSWTFGALLIIVLFGSYFRLYQLDRVPPEMTSDHVEKVLDSQLILNGTPQVFFPNNGGRDPMQFYLLAFLKGALGMPLNFLTLKLLTVVEGIISIVLLWWMGREVVGAEDRRLGNIVGLVLAALVAVSYWHTSLSRLGLRIILTVSFTAVLIVFLARALRHNRRGDYIKAGLVLGFGLYAYQAVRMLPVVIVVGVALAVLFRGLSTRFGRRGNWEVRRYVFHLVILSFFALVVFVPLLTFSLQYPNDFWRRTSGRLLGDDLIQTVDAEGNIIERVPTLQERIDAFNSNWPILTDNIRNALLMYNWKGDVAWINAAPNRPAMDIFTGTLFILGLGAWTVRIVRRRDVVDWLLPILLFIMLLPSALSIAYPVENPSATRTSGTLPVAYLFAAFPLALICLQIVRIMPRRGLIFAGGLSVVLVLSAFNANQDVYLNEYRFYYTGSSLPYSDAGKTLQGFADSGGSYGNAFMIAYPYWWDHRAVGIEAGLLDWPNGIVTLGETPSFLLEASTRAGRYQLNPDKDLLFMYSIHDEDTELQLQEWFPNGYSLVIESYQPEDNYKVFRVPALGTDALIEFFVRSGVAG